MRHTIQPEDVDAVHQQRIALRPIIAIERERTLYRESRVDDTAISLAEKIVDTEIENVYSPLNSRTFPKAITKNCDKRPAAAFAKKAAAVVKMSILRAIPHNSKCRYGERGAADAVPQLPERCLSRKAGIVRCCLRIFRRNCRRSRRCRYSSRSSCRS